MGCLWTDLSLFGSEGLCSAQWFRNEIVLYRFIYLLAAITGRALIYTYATLIPNIRREISKEKLVMCSHVLKWKNWDVEMVQELLSFSLYISPAHLALILHMFSLWIHSTPIYQQKINSSQLSLWVESV